MRPTTPIESYGNGCGPIDYELDYSADVHHYKKDTERKKHDNGMKVYDPFVRKLLVAILGANIALATFFMKVWWDDHTAVVRLIELRIVDSASIESQAKDIKAINSTLMQILQQKKGL